ncbi:MAG TPA: DNA alkylation repair protein [Patescibacteria group bacterium]|nr:DNA alkylation repair protein [Patescibacteria group bacterium]
MDPEGIIKKLKSFKNPKNVEGMARFGINPKYALGINIPILRKLAKDINKDPRYKNNSYKLHQLAQGLWKSKIHEARILAGMVEASDLVTEKQMDSWTKDFNSWDLCDQTCMNLFWKHPDAYKKARIWTKLKPEFERRAGFSLMAVLAWHDKNASDTKFEKFFPFIKNCVTDERNYVKKAVNWALRQIGKRNPYLKEKSKDLAKEITISFPNSKSAQWIAKDALRELNQR